MAEAKDIAQFIKKVKKPEEQSVAYPKPFSNEIQFDRNNVLGRGNSVVYHGTYKGDPVAVKRIVVDLLSEEDREIRTQVKLDHENVLKIVTVEQDSDFRYIVLELCAGTLADVVNETYKGPELSSDMTVLNEIATGLHYIHSKKLVHRDIKPDNILISSNGRIKISDFDLCKETSTNRTYLVSGPFKGTKFWMAKELLNVYNNNSIPVVKGSIKSDIFSAGCVFFYFVTRGIHPFGLADSIVRNILADNIVNFDRLNEFHCAWDIIRAMLKHEPNERITLEEILRRFEYQLITLMDEKRAANIVRRIAEKNNPFVVYNLPIEKYHETDSLRVDYYVFGKPANSPSHVLENSRRKTILMFELCSETINVINAMINYVLDVKWEDNFRFKLNDEAFSPKEKMVTLFHFNEIEGSRLGFPLTIVIKPGKLVCRGWKRLPERIDEEFQNSFYSLAGEMKQPDAICFIIPLEDIETIEDHRGKLYESTYQEMKLLSTLNAQVIDKYRFIANFANFVKFNSPTVNDSRMDLLDIIRLGGGIVQDEYLYEFICSSVFMLNGNKDDQNRANFEMTVNRFDQFFSNL